MYKKIMVFGMVMLIMLCTPLPSYASDLYPYKLSVKLYTSNSVFISETEMQSNLPFKFDLNSNNSFVFYGNGYIKLREFNSSSWTDYTNLSYTSYQSLLTGSSNILYEILSCNHNLYSTTGYLNYDYINANTQQFDGRITLPANDGYKDNGTTFTFWHWYQLPTGVDSTDVKIDPYIDDSKDTYHSAAVTLHQKIPNTSKWNLNINLTVLDYGPHTYKVVFKQISTGNVLGTLTRTFEALEGFIDENGDGLDDRTGQPPYTPLDPPGTNPGEWDGTILGFFQYLIDSVKYYVQNIVDGINVTMGAIGKVPQIMGTILNFPEPLTALLIFGVTCTIILAIFRR